MPKFSECRRVRLAALCAALNRKNVAAATALIEARANVDDRFDFGGAALYLACRPSNCH